MGWKKISQYDYEALHYDDEYDYNDDDAYYDYDPVVSKPEQQAFAEEIKSLPIYFYNTEWYEHGQGSPGEEGNFKYTLLPGWSVDGKHEISESTRDGVRRAVSKMSPCNCYNSHLYSNATCKLINPDKKPLTRTEITDSLNKRPELLKRFWQDLDKAEI